MNEEELKKVEKTKKVINVIINVVFAVFMVFILVFIIMQLQLKKNVENGLPNAFGISFVRVDSDSMAREYSKALNDRTGSNDYGKGFDVGDIIIVKSFKNEEEARNAGLKAGDVITYMSFVTLPDKTRVKAFVTHRIVEYNEESYTFTVRGDKQESMGVTDQDDTVYFSEIAGVYKSGIVLKGLGSFMESKWVFFAFIIVPLLLFLVFEVLNFIKALKNYNEEQKALKPATLTVEEAEKTSAELEAQLAALQAQLAAQKEKEEAKQESEPEAPKEGQE